VNKEEVKGMTRQHGKGSGSGGGKRLLCLRELPTVYGCSLWWWRSRIWRGEIPAIKLGGKYLLDVRDVERLIERHKQVAVN
jgi:hypothetical protein